MKIRTCLTVLATLVCAGTVASQGIQPPSLGGGNRGKEKFAVGSDAPDIDIQEWIKGEKVEHIVEEQAYVIEFWATTDARSRASIEQLTEFAQHYSTVKFIGVSVEDPNVVRAFVAKMGDKVDFLIAIDNRERTQRQFMRAASIETIPTAFIIDQNKRIAYIGDPMVDEFADILAKVASGRYDPELMQAAAPFLAQVDHCVKVRDWRVCENYIDQVIEMSPNVFNKVAMDKFKIWLMDKDDVEGAIAYARGTGEYAGVGFIQTYESDAESLGMLAKRILSDKMWLSKSPDELRSLSLDLANAAYNADTGPASLSVLAMANYQNGNVLEAINQQRKAYLLADPDDKVEMKRMLDQFVNGVASRR